MAEDKIYFFTPVDTKDRFNAGDEPTESTFRKFADSIPMKNEADSAATTSQQGLVVRATQQEIDTETGDGVVTSSELPQTSVFNFASTIVPNPQLSVTKIKNGVKNVFRIGLTQAFIQFLEKATIPYIAGSIDQVLTKTGADTFEWKDAPVGFEPNGTANQLIKGDGGYEDKYTVVGLNGGSVSQVLTKTDGNTGGYSWQNIPNQIPTGGSSGQVLTNIGNDNFTWQTVTSYTFATSGTGESVYDATNTSGTDIKFRGIKKSDSSTFPFIIQTNGNNIEIDINKVNPNDGLDLDTNQVTWGAMGAPSVNNFYGWIQHMVDTINSKS